MQRGHAELTYNMDMQYGRVAWTLSLDMQYGRAAWTLSVEMKHGREAWTCSNNMYQGCSIDMMPGHVIITSRRNLDDTVTTLRVLKIKDIFFALFRFASFAFYLEQKYLLKQRFRP
jgi:hypothetical protein